MIVELSDGRELRVPDSWSEEQAVAFGRGYMAGEISEDQKDAAERDAELERDESVAGEIKRLQATLSQVLQAVSADRVLVYGSDGEPFASRVNIPRSYK